MAERYIAFVLRHRVAVLFICAAITVPAIWSCTRGVIASSMLKLFFGESEAYDRYVELANQFGDSDLMIVAFRDPELLTAEGIERIERISESIVDLDWIERVDSVANADRIDGDADELRVEPYGPLLKHADGNLAALRREIIEQPLLKGLLVSNDGTAGTLLIEFASGPERPIEEVPAMLDEVIAPFLREGYHRDRLHLGGMVPESVEATEQAHFNINRIFPIAVVVLIVIVYLLFMQLWPVMITTGVAFISVTWSFAIAILYDHQVNIMMATVPAVIMVVAFSDIIHLCSAYLLELRAGHSKEDAILKSGAEVGTACFYTSVTTLLGFAAIAFIPTPMFRQLGLVLGFGVAIALLLAMTLVPIFFSYMPAPRRAAERTGRGPSRIIDAFTGACLRLSTRHPAAVAGGFLVIAVISAVGMSRIKVETNLAHRLEPDNHIRVAQRFMAENFVGTNFMDLYLHANGDGDLLDPDTFHAVARFQKALEALPGVDRTLSLVDLIELLHQEMAIDAKGEPLDGSLPASRALLAQYLLLFEMSGGEGLERMVDEEHRTMRITVRLPRTGLVETSEVGNAAVALGREIIGEHVHIEPTGLTYLFGEWLEFILAGQKRGLAFALITIGVMMMVTLRRFGAGLVSMIPNVLPLAVLGGYLGLSWPTVDSDTLLVAMIAVGMAVDDTIHFLTRLRLEVQRCATIDEALEETFAFTGRAIVLTTVILCVGFFPWLMSDYFSTKILGSLLPLALAMALFADLLLVPALVKLRIMRLDARGPRAAS